MYKPLGLFLQGYYDLRVAMPEHVYGYSPDKIKVFLSICAPNFCPPPLPEDNGETVVSMHQIAV